MSAYKPSRFILHTDVEEAFPIEEDIVELPPQYTDRRQPPNEVERQPSNGIRRRPSGNVPPQDIPPIFPNLSRSPPEGQSWFWSPTLRSSRTCIVDLPLSFPHRMPPPFRLHRGIILLFSLHQIYAQRLIYVFVCLLRIRFVRVFLLYSFIGLLT